MGPGHELFVQPAASDAGTALGAATYAAHQLGDRIQPMAHAYLGPEYSPDEIEAVLRKREIRYERCASITDTASELLAKGEVVAWFQGRMEFGPRALGNRSILGNPASRGVADRINAKSNIASAGAVLSVPAGHRRAGRVANNASLPLHDVHLRRGGSLEAADSRGGA